ncbi:MAG: hypothetical protein HY820_02535 [Acidobacteria bacterium]|nr:hypothetical protein [Acidobacteriota bacterium]
MKRLLFSPIAALVVLSTCALTGQSTYRRELGPALIVPDPPGAPIAPDVVTPRAPYTSSTWFDTTSRSAIKTAYETILAPTVPTAVSWTGSVDANNPGTTSQTYKDAVLTRINWFRAMAGVPANIALDATYSSKNQKAALMMSANNQLNHFPPTSWKDWSQDGYDAAGKSNLCYGTSYPSEYLSNNPGCVHGYMDDDGANNTAVGHRRWLLVPQTRFMGTGDVTQFPLSSTSPTYGSANAIWVQDGHYSDPRPTTRDTFVAWPPKGYVPYQVVPRRWSVSYASANFTSANVTMSVNGVNVPLTKLTVQPPSGYIGENTLVWEPATDFTGQPSSDTTVNVTVTGVSGYPGGSTITYSVIIFDPAQGASLQPPVLVSPANGATSVSIGATLSWNASSGATSYDVYVGSSNPPPFVGNVSGTSTTLSGLSSATTYYWKIVAKNASTTASSSVWSFTTAGSGPGAPSLVSPSNGATGVGTSSALSWSSGSGATSYDVYIGTTNPPPYVANTAGLSYSPSLSAATTYYWKVVSKSGSGSATSAVWSFTTASGFPAAPTLVSPANGATGVSTSASLSWNSASGATSYDVYFGTTASPPNVGNTGGLSYAPSMSAGTTYYWKIVAKNSSGTTSSVVRSFTTASTGPPAPSLSSPANGATGVATSAQLSWNSSGGATSYDVYFGTINPPPYVTNTSGLSYSPNLSSGTTYYWKVAARNSSGATSSSVWSFVTVSGGGPGAFSLVSPSNGATGVVLTGLQLSWTTSSGATSYEVYIGPTNPPPFAGNISGTSATITSTLAAATVYYWKVIAKNSSGSTSSPIRTFTTIGLVGPGPFSLSSPADGAIGIARTGLVLTWTASAGAIGYDLYIGDGEYLYYEGTVSGLGATLTTTLSAGTTYYWLITAWNNDGERDSDVWAFTTASAAPGSVNLLSPANGAGTVAPSGVQLTWSASNDATSYDVYFGTANPPPLTGTVAGTSYPLNMTLNAGTTFYWKVVAINSSSSTSSAIWSFTTAVVSGPPAPVLSYPTNSYGGVAINTALSWNAASGATSYDVYFGSSNPPPLVTNTTALTYTPGGLNYSTVYYWKVASRNTSGTTDSALWSFTTASNTGTPSGLRFVPLTPCRLVDTRPAYAGPRTGSFGPPLLSGGTVRTIPIQSSTTCSVPSAAKAYVFNLTLDTYENQTGPVDLVTLWPAGEARPDFYTARTSTGGYIANAAIVKAGAGGAVNVYASSNVNLILDISGYFTDDASPSGLLYYPISPCRAVDTRGPIYSSLPQPYGNQRMQSRENRTFRIPGSPACTIPVAAAYSMQLTLAPGELTNGDPVAFITAYPSNLPQPNISNMNALFGYAVANSAIVPASANGSIDVFAYDATNLIIDINGYFAPDDGTGRGLYYYPTTQCRVLNTQDGSLAWPFGGPAVAAGADRTVPVPSGRCAGLPSSARAWAMNASVTPNGVGMPYLSMWPSGTAWPNVSQLNAFQGQMLANSGIVPASASGSIDVRVASTTHVTLEVSGYFGR